MNDKGAPRQAGQVYQSGAGRVRIEVIPYQREWWGLQQRRCGRPRFVNENGAAAPQHPAELRSDIGISFGSAGELCVNTLEQVAIVIPAEGDRVRLGSNG